MILRLLLAFGFMVLGANFPIQTLESARIMWSGVVLIASNVYKVLYPDPPAPKVEPQKQATNQPTP